MKQRVAIARTLALDPRDPADGRALRRRARRADAWLMHEELLAILQRRPQTVVFVTHDVREAVYLADRVAVMTARPPPRQGDRRQPLRCAAIPRSSRPPNSPRRSTTSGAWYATRR